jgi:fermentation-respiration switch protein FrsA (DUF1100 family)
VLVTQGDADTINPPSFGLAVFEQARPPRYLLVIEGGGHLPPLQPGSRWFPGVVAVTLAFLDAYDGSGPASAIPAAARYPGLSLRSG